MIKLFTFILLTLSVFNCNLFDDSTPLIPVSSVSVDNSVVGLVVGDASSTVVATVSPADATDKAVTWTSSDSAIAIVSSSGEIEAVSVGTTTIKVITADGGHTARVIVRVTASAISVTGVRVASVVGLVVGGASSTVVATVSPADATDKAVRWTSSDTAIATVSSSGEIRGESEGTANIIVTTVDGGHTDTVVARVTTTAVSVTNVSIALNTFNLVAGLFTEVEATVSPADATNKTVIWSSSDSSVATVNQSGNVTALALGTAMIIVRTMDGGHTDTLVLTVTGVSVTSVSVSNDTVNLVVGISSTLTATVEPINASNKALTWATIDESIATVNSNEIRGVAIGTTTLTVRTTDGGHMDTVVVIVTAPVRVSGVTFNHDTLYLVRGAIVRFSVTVLPYNATAKRVTFSSSDENIAPISVGEITGGSLGTANIIVTTVDGGYTDTVVVIIGVSVSVDIETVNLVVGETATVVATVLPTNAIDKSVSWRSGSDRIATVDANGVITGRSAGDVFIRVTATNGGHTAELLVRVTAETEIETAVSGVSVDIGAVNLVVGETATIEATVLPATATNQVVIWSSNGHFGILSIAQDSRRAIIRGVGVGTTTLTVTTTEGRYIDTVVVVVTGVSVTSVSVDSDTVNLKVNETSSITATILPANATNKALTWTSSDSSIATISSFGLQGILTGESLGTATITVRTTDGGYIDTVVVIVTGVSVTSVNVVRDTVNLGVGATETVEATILPVNASNKAVTWSSSDNAKVTVDANGVITAVAIGTATITVTTTDGDYTDTLVVIVTAPVSVTSVSVVRDTINLGARESSTIAVTVLPVNATNKVVTWSSSDISIATVSNGIITGGSLGTATLTVTTIDGSHTDTVVITVTTAFFNMQTRGEAWSGRSITETINANNIVDLQRGGFDTKNMAFTGGFNSSASEGLLYASGGTGKGLTFGYKDGAFIVSIGEGNNIDAQVTGLSQNTNYIYQIQIRSNNVIEVGVYEGTGLFLNDIGFDVTTGIVGIDLVDGNASSYLRSTGSLQYPLADFQGIASRILFISGSADVQDY